MTEVHPAISVVTNEGTLVAEAILKTLVAANILSDYAILPRENALDICVRQSTEDKFIYMPLTFEGTTDV